MSLDDRHIILPVAVEKISGEGLENLQQLKLMGKKNNARKICPKLKA